MLYKFLLQLLMVANIINSMNITQVLLNEIIVDISHRLYTDPVPSLSIPDDTQETAELVLTHSCIVNHYNEKSNFNSLKMVNKATYALLQKVAYEWQKELVKELLAVNVDPMIFFNYAKSNGLFISHFNPSNPLIWNDDRLDYHLNTDIMHSPVENKMSVFTLMVQEKLNCDTFFKLVDSDLFLIIGTTFENLNNLSPLEKKLQTTHGLLERFNLLRLAFLEKSTLNYFLNFVAPHSTGFTYKSRDGSNLFYKTHCAYHEFDLKITNIPLTLFYEMCIKKIKNDRINGQNKS